MPFSSLTMFSRIGNVPGALGLLTLCILALLIIGCDLFPSNANKPAIATSTSTPMLATSAKLPSSSPTTAALPPEPSEPPEPPIPTAVPTVPVTLTPNVSMAQAWGAQIYKQVKHIPIVLGSDNSYSLFEQSITEDGKFLLATYNPSDAENNPDKQPRVMIIDIASGQSTEIGRTPKAAVEPYGVNGDDNWIIWTQAPQGPGFFSDWVIYAYNRADHSTKELARAARGKDGMPVLGSDGSAQIDHGRVVWSEGVQDDPKAASHTFVRMMDMNTGQVTTLSSHGLYPMISWPHVAWIELQLPPEGSPTPAPGQAKAAITVLNLENGKKRVLTKPDKPSSMALYKNSFVWISSDSKRVLLTDLDETFEQTIAVIRGGGSFQNPSMNDRLITWGSQSDPVVWDRKQNKLITVASSDASHLFVGPHDFVWEGHPHDAPKADSGINILDTTQLP